MGHVGLTCHAYVEAQLQHERCYTGHVGPSARAGLKHDSFHMYRRKQKHNTSSFHIQNTSSLQDSNFRLQTQVQFTSTDTSSHNRSLGLKEMFYKAASLMLKYK
jgi:hypothetical protein